MGHPIFWFSRKIELLSRMGWDLCWHYLGVDGASGLAAGLAEFPTA
jgi:hypothetical protein